MKLKSFTFHFKGGPITVRAFNYQEAEIIAKAEAIKRGWDYTIVNNLDDVYKALGFKTPSFVQNSCGIKIYIGTKGHKDWCVEIPKELAKIKCPDYPFDCNYAVYLTSEEEVVQTAQEFTKLAERVRATK